MKIMKAVAAALALVSCMAVAQAPAPATPEQKAAVKELMVALNFKEMMSQMSGAMASSMPQMVEQMTSGMLAGATDEQKAEARRLAAKSAAASGQRLMALYQDPAVMSGMEDIMAAMYLKHFTLEEVRAITAFYVSPAGKKTLTIMPAMMQEAMPKMMALITPRMNKLMEEIARDIAAEAKAAKDKAGK